MQNTPSSFKRIHQPKSAIFNLSLPNGEKLKTYGIMTHVGVKKYMMLIPFKKMASQYHDRRIEFFVSNALSRVPDETREMYPAIVAMVDKSSVIKISDDSSLAQVVSEIQEELAEISRLEKEIQLGFVKSFTLGVIPS